MAFFIAALSSFFIAFLLLPLIIRVSRFANLMDNPDIRKNHLVATPVLGGIAILTGFIFALFLSVSIVEMAKIKYYLFGLLIIFMMGLRDDISGLVAKHKLFAQVFAAFLIVQFSDLRLTGFYGLAGIGSMPEWFNILFSIFVVVALTNSFNLLDGIDGLAGSISLLILTFFGFLFYLSGDTTFALACISLVGSIFAFLIFNWRPAKVFMGDTGSMILGLTIATFSFRVLNIDSALSFYGLEFETGVPIVLSALVIPIVDTLRVFIIRFSNGKNPLDPDRNHLHHELKRLGLNDAQATLLLVAVNLTFSISVFFLSSVLGDGLLILIVTSCALVLVFILERKVRQLPVIEPEDQSEKKLYVSKSA